MRRILVLLLVLLSGPALAQKRPPGYEPARQSFEALPVEQRLFVQMLLISAGYWNAMPNVEFNGRIFTALSNFQRENGYPVNGRLDVRQVKHLGDVAQPLLSLWGFRNVRHPIDGSVSLWVPLGLGLRPQRVREGWDYTDPTNRVNVKYSTYEGRTVEDVYANLLNYQTRNNFTINYKIIKDGFGVISSSSPDGVDYYLRFHQNGPMVTGFIVNWASEAARDLHIERVAILMSASLWSNMTGAPFVDPPVMDSPAPVARNAPPSGQYNTPGYSGNDGYVPRPRESADNGYGEGGVSVHPKSSALPKAQEQFTPSEAPRTALVPDGTYTPPQSTRTPTPDGTYSRPMPTDRNMADLNTTAPSTRTPSDPSATWRKSPGEDRIEEARKEEEGDSEGGPASGSGFFVTKDGHVVTNHHVIKSCTNGILVRHGTGDPVYGRLINSDEAVDLALLKTTLKPSQFASLSTSVRLGEPVAAFGYPLAGLLSTDGNFTLGNVTALNGLGNDDKHIQISAAVQAGNSGGPLMDEYGNLIGVVDQQLNAIKMAVAGGVIPQNVNFAIKATTLETFLNANNISPAKGMGGPKFGPTELADRAKATSVYIECEK